MHFQGNQVHIKKSYLYFFIFIILFAFATPVLADYLGPDRTVTTASESCKMILYECMYVAAKGDYRYHRVEDWSCSNESKPWEAYDNSTVACEPWNVGRTYYDKDYSVVTTTITQPEATVNSNLQNCTLQNGWCVTPPQLEITAVEPLSGYQIILIEGTRNIEQFACNDVTCTVPLLEGENTFEYWAISSWGDSSRKGTNTTKVDTVAPNVNLQVNGVLGLNNWYTSDVKLTAIGQDTTSGLLEALLSVDNGAYTPTTTLSDGVYQVEIIAKDNALNISTASATIQVDTTTPTLTLSISGTKGNNNFYTSNVTITPNANDVTSGVERIEVSINGGARQVITAPITLSDGIHTYQFRVYDKAGNFTESPIQQISIDTIPPTVEADEEINLGNTIYYTLRDNGSGVAISRIVIEDEDEKYKKIVWLEEITGNKIEGDILWDGKFADKTLAGVGEYYITFKISDRAGNETFYTTIVNVNPISYFQIIPEFTPPTSQLENQPTSPLDNEESTEQSFGGTPAQNNNESTTQTLEFSSSATAGMNASTTTTSTSDILWGVIAASAIGMATAYAVGQQQRRDEDEAQQLAQVQASVDAQNAAIEANRIAMMEQLRIRNWLEGQAMLDAQIEQLESQGATPEQIADLREQGATQGLGLAINNAQNLGQSLAMQQMINQQAYDIYRQGEYVSVPIEENNPFIGAVASGGLGNSSSAGGSGHLASLSQEGDNPPWWNIWDENWTLSNAVEDIQEGWNNFWYGDINNQTQPTPTSTLAPWWFTPSPTSTPTLQQTPTHIFTPTPRPTSSYLEDQLQAYGIQLFNADSSLINTVFQATQLAAQTFQPRTGGTLQQSFIMSHGTIAIIIDENAQFDDGNCETARVIRGTRFWPRNQDEPTLNVQSTIICETPPTLTNLLHEYSHAFEINHSTYGISNNFISNNLGNLIVDGDILRQIFPDYVERTPLGFNGSASPSLENPSSQLLIEEFADTQMNALLDGIDINNGQNGFSNDSYGDARREEWNSLMNQWEQDMQDWFDEFLRE